MQNCQSTKNGALNNILIRHELFSNSSAPWQQSILASLINQLNLDGNLKCLDSACGIGNNIKTLSIYFESIYAFDKSLEALELAKANFINNHNVHFKLGNLELIDYPDNMFDISVCTEALEHIENYPQAVKELYRVTKSNGYMLISFQNHCNLSGLWKYFYEAIFKCNWDVWGTHRHQAGYENYINVFKVRKLIKRIGLISIDERGADYINAWFFWLPFIYRNYKILDNYPFLYLGKLPVIKYFGMDYFMLLKKNGHTSNL